MVVVVQSVAPLGEGSCTRVLPLPGDVITMVATGDHDGDGRAELATLSGNAVLLWSL